MKLHTLVPAVIDTHMNYWHFLRQQLVEPSGKRSNKFLPCLMEEWELNFHVANSFHSLNGKVKDGGDLSV